MARFARQRLKHLLVVPSRNDFQQAKKVCSARRRIEIHLTCEVLERKGRTDGN
jgi:hypothetical protein